MTFRFIGLDGSAPAPGPTPEPGSRVSVFETIQATQFTNENPAADKFVQIWDPNVARLPEPDISHVLLTGRLPQLDKASDANNYPGSCGAAFGYARLLKGNIPQKLYAWKGWWDTFPYRYNDPYHTSGFSFEPRNNFQEGAFQIPVPAKQSNFRRRSFPAPDAVAGKHGDWAITFSGGAGAWSSTPPDFTFTFAAGSSASIFGPGYDATPGFAGGTGGPATATARGPAATRMHPDVIPEWAAITKAFIVGDDPTQSRLEGASGKAKFGPLPTNLYLYSASVPFAIDDTLLKLPTGMETPYPSGGTNKMSITLTIINQYFAF